jgi:hypothetical protein
MGGFVAPLVGQLNQALTNYAKGFRQNGLVSDIVAPRVPVERQTDSYYIWDRADQMLDFNDLRAPGSGAEKVRRSLSTSTYTCFSHALQAPIADEARVNAEQNGLANFVSAQGRTSFLQRKILLKKEKRLVDLMTTGNVTNNTTLSGTDQWTDLDHSDPATDVEKGKKIIRRAGVNATHMIIGEDVYAALRTNKAVLDAFKYTRPGGSMIGLPELQAFFDIPNVILAGAMSVSTSDGTTASVLWDADDVLICYVDPSPSQEDVSFMRTFVWAQAPGTVGGYGVVIGRDPDPTAKSETVGVDFYYDQKITAVETGYLIKDATG